jgi:hypothetical protein
MPSGFVLPPRIVSLQGEGVKRQILIFSSLSLANYTNMFLFVICFENLSIWGKTVISEEMGQGLDIRTGHLYPSQFSSYQNDSGILVTLTVCCD